MTFDAADVNIVDKLIQEVDFQIYRSIRFAETASRVHRRRQRHHRSAESVSSKRPAPVLYYLWHERKFILKI